MSQLKKFLRSWFLQERRKGMAPKFPASKDGPKLISVHLPKCAGTSFLKVLGVQYGSRLMLDYDEIPLDPESLFQKDFPVWAEQQKSALTQDFSRVFAVHGHFWAGKYDQALPGALKITFLRDPIRRLVSHYYYWKSKPSLPNSLHRTFVEKNASLLEFAEFPIMQNVYTKTFLRGHTLDQFAFVGICENLAEDIQRLRRQLGWPEVVLPRANRTEHPEYKAHSLDQVVEAKLRKLNEADVDVYRTALERRERDLKG